MAGSMPGLLTLMEELYGRINKERLFGGGVRGAATRGLLGADAPEDATPAEMEAYRNIANASMALAAGPVAATRAVKGAKTLKDAPRAEAMETARQNAVKMLGLPESNTAMDRAKAMGFVHDELFHGTVNDFPAFKVSDRSSVYATDSPAIADIYANATGRHKGLREVNAGPNVMPLMYRGKLLEVSDQGKTGGGWLGDNLAAALGTEPRRNLVKEVPSKGYSGIKVKDMDDLGGRQSQYIFPDPAVLRSRFAAFDPARIDEKDLLASLAAMGITLPLTMGLLSEQTD